MQLNGERIYVQAKENKMIIKKKIWPEFFELIKSGKKKFELRVADFDIKEGDTF